jgi:hypothetical protein
MPLQVLLGILALLVTLAFLAVKFARSRRTAPLPLRGWVGLAVILVAEVLLFLRAPWLTIYFTPIVWTGFLLLADGLVGSLEGRSRMASDLGGFLALGFWSVPLWLLFEAYNLRLANWTYVGLPESALLRGLGYVWSFATIWPGIFLTADLLRALGLFGGRVRQPLVSTRRARLTMMLAGLLMVTVPVLVPVAVGQHLFGAVWLGFIFLLDPLNYEWGGRSLLGDLERADTSRLASFLAAGLICGLLWEFWNYWAAAKWLYIFPIFQDWKIFEMPLLGYLGFPPFALECFVMYEFLRTLKTRLRVRERSAGREAAA